MLLDSLQQRLLQHAQNNLVRKQNVVTTAEVNAIVVAGKKAADFSSNDYLGLKKHPCMIEAVITAAKQYGVGSGASAQISGYSDLHAEVETAFAQWLKVDKAILFNSGYCANTGIISALVTRGDTIFSDKLLHASLLDGILLARAKHYRYQHNDLNHFKYLATKKAPDLIVTESIFSMEGDVAAITELTQLAQQYNAKLLIDDAHGIGILGKHGAGIMEQCHLEQTQFACLVLPLGKAFNAMGAIVAGRQQVMDAILQFAKTYRYATALPPLICNAILAALDIIQTETWRREQLAKNIQFFNTYCKEKKLTLISPAATPIRSVLIHDSNNVLALQQFLLEKGFFVSAIRPPTVPKNTARLRVSLNSEHTETQIMALIDCIQQGLASE